MKTVCDDWNGHGGGDVFRGTDGILRPEGEDANRRIKGQDADGMTVTVIYQMVDSENSIYEYDLNCMNKKKITGKAEKG